MCAAAHLERQHQVLPQRGWFQRDAAVQRKYAQACRLQGLWGGAVGAGQGAERGAARSQGRAPASCVECTAGKLPSSDLGKPPQSARPHGSQHRGQPPPPRLPGTRMARTGWTAAWPGRRSSRRPPAPSQTSGPASTEQCQRGERGRSGVRQYRWTMVPQALHILGCSAASARQHA